MSTLQAELDTFVVVHGSDSTLFGTSLAANSAMATSTTTSLSPYLQRPLQPLIVADSVPSVVVNSHSTDPRGSLDAEMEELCAEDSVSQVDNHSLCRNNEPLNNWTRQPLLQPPIPLNSGMFQRPHSESASFHGSIYDAVLSQVQHALSGDTDIQPTWDLVDIVKSALEDPANEHRPLGISTSQVDAPQPSRMSTEQVNAHRPTGALIGQVNANRLTGTCTEQVNVHRYTGTFTEQANAHRALNTFSDHTILQSSFCQHSLSTVQHLDNSTDRSSTRTRHEQISSVNHEPVDDEPSILIYSSHQTNPILSPMERSYCDMGPQQSISLPSDTYNLSGDWTRSIVTVKQDSNTVAEQPRQQPGDQTFDTILPTFECDDSDDSCLRETVSWIITIVHISTISYDDGALTAKDTMLRILEKYRPSQQCETRSDMTQEQYSMATLSFLQRHHLM
jgi:hypothetical protein